MLRIAAYFLMLTLAAALLVSCEEPDPLQADSEATLPAGFAGEKTWYTQSVTFIENEVEQDPSFYQDLQITFTADDIEGLSGTYTVTNGGEAFPQESGRWNFILGWNRVGIDSTQNPVFPDVILRTNDGVEMTVVDFSAVEMEISFIKEGSVFGGGRTTVQPSQSFRFVLRDTP